MLLSLLMPNNRGDGKVQFLASQNYPILNSGFSIYQEYSRVSSIIGVSHFVCLRQFARHSRFYFVAYCELFHTEESTTMLSIENF
jgi:hypothetical protein